MATSQGLARLTGVRISIWDSHMGKQVQRLGPSSYCSLTSRELDQKWNRIDDHMGRQVTGLTHYAMTLYTELYTNKYKIVV